MIKILKYNPITLYKRPHYLIREEKGVVLLISL